jgi:copper homeostasis protein
MNETFLLEISVESLDAAMAAERAGAARVELCSNLREGGITPAPDLLRQVRAALKIPVFPIIRPRGGDFIYDERELTAMAAQIAAAKEMGVDGVVLGVLRPDSSVDVSRTKELIDCADPLPVTFHRAFDQAKDFLEALEAVIATGARRLLTSGGAESVPEGLPMLRELLEAAAERIIVMPGRGLNAGNFAEVRRALPAREFHSGLGTVLPYDSSDFTRFEAEIRAMLAPFPSP